MFELLDTLPPVPAQVELAARDALGAIAKKNCTLMLAQYDDDQFANLVEQVQADTLTDKAIASMVLIDWADVGVNGVQLDCSPENKAKFLRQPGVSSAIVRKFFDMRKELVAATEKNSPSSANTSPGAAGE
jgi:hypothetical protein